MSVVAPHPKRALGRQRQNERLAHQVAADQAAAIHDLGNVVRHLEECTTRSRDPYWQQTAIEYRALLRRLSALDPQQATDETVAQLREIETNLRDALCRLLDYANLRLSKPVADTNCRD